ncbi:general substrate transporter [Mycena sp. CBHHK59/15]|nr:general substrate transporter [Mycena sp. CBHHK59/15]
MVSPTNYDRPRLVGQPLLYAISVFASLGVFLFGYDQGVMSGIITGPHFIEYFHAPGSVKIGSMVAVLEVGAFVTSLAAGRIGDIIGRKGTLFIGALVFTVGGAIQTFTSGFGVMVLGRVVSGFGVGLLSTIVPIYQSEVSPPNHRGALACAEFTGNIFGYAFSVWTDYFCSFIESDNAWRIPLFIQCIIGAILAAGSLFMPESPRWLIDTDKDEQGMKVLVDLHGGDPRDAGAKAEFQEIKDKVLMERNSGDGRSYGAMWRRYKRRILLAMSSQAFAQLNGINVISYYARTSLTSPLHAPTHWISAKVFEEAGWHGRQALLMTGINAIIYTLSTLPPWYLVDRWGRRPILLSGAAVMGLSLCATGWFMYLDREQTPGAVVVCVIVFNAAFGYRSVFVFWMLPASHPETSSCGWGPVPWLYPPEILPLTIRAKGVSLSTATNWAFNTLVGEMTPYLQEVVEWRLYVMHGFFCGCSFVLVYFLYPETKGVPLEEMDVVFGDAEKIPLSGFPSPEHAALVARRGDSYPPSVGRRHPAHGWFGYLFGGNAGAKDLSSYQPIDGEEAEMERLRGDEEDAEGYEVLERQSVPYVRP